VSGILCIERRNSQSCRVYFVENSPQFSICCLQVAHILGTEVACDEEEDFAGQARPGSRLLCSRKWGVSQCVAP